MRVLFATTNKGKLNEAQRAASALPLEFVSATEIVSSGIAHSIPEVEENEPTYEGNARLKADAFFAWSGLPSVSDDSGLEVVSLGGAPGIYSARYAGEGATREQNNQKLLDALGGVSDRRARFVCCLVLKIAEGDYLVASGSIHGEIGYEPAGTAGFGYDNLFLVSGTGKTLAALKEGGEIVTTHRTRALFALVSELRKRI